MKPNGPIEIPISLAPSPAPSSLVEGLEGPPRAETTVQNFAEEHRLKNSLRTSHIWAMGVGCVITGEYFGWNPGLKEGGPIGMLIASLFVCLLYMCWVLALSELSVAMPYAGGPLAYGRKAFGPAVGFLMGWSMFLECLFATIGTAVATGGAVYFLVKLFWPEMSEAEVTLACAIVTVLLFSVLQWIGTHEQATVMQWMTYGAIAGLVWFWLAAWPGVRLERITAEPFADGWKGILRAIPYAIWWLVIIETVALAAEEAHEPHKTIPRGLTYAQMTLIGLVMLTWFFASAAGNDYRQTGSETVLYPLQFVYGQVWPEAHHRWHLAGFSLVALCGLGSSYNGMIYAVSRQSFSLGRAGYLPRILGELHASRRTPTISIAFWSFVVLGFVIWNYFKADAVTVAVLTCNLTALIWYSLAMLCLFRLRKTHPDMPRPYKVPLYPYLPGAVLVMSVFSALIYGGLQKPIVLWLTLAMYAGGFAYYVGYARTRRELSAPEEMAARDHASSN